MNAWEIVQAVVVLALAALPFLGGARATVDPDDHRYAGQHTRTSRARIRARAPRRSGTAGAGASPESSAPAHRPGRRGRVVARSAAPAGLHWAPRP